MLTNRTNRNSFYAYLLFFIWPFLAFVLSFKWFKYQWAKNLVWLFVIFYGLTFVISDEGMDAFRYRENFYYYAQNNFNLEEFFIALYSESDKVDILQSLLNFVVSKFTENYHILFGVYGLVFGYFYSRNIWYLLDKVGSKVKNENIIILICFSLIVGFWEINGFRFWTATHMFLFGLLPYLYEKKYKYLLFCFLTIFVHFSFVMPSIILLLYLFIGNRFNYFFYFYIFTFFITEINVVFIKDNLYFLPDIFFDRTEGYLNEDYKVMIQEKRASYNWYAQYYKEMFNWACLVLISVCYFKIKSKIKKNKPIFRLFSFSLLFGGFANILSNIPSGGRFIALTHLLFFTIFFFYLQNYQRVSLFRNITYLSYPIFILFILLSLRIGLITISLTAIAGNPLLALLGENETSLLSLIK